MKAISNSDFYLILRLLADISDKRGGTRKEKENARKAYLLHKKLKRKDEKENGAERDTGTLRAPAG